MCIIITQPICNYKDKNISKSPFILVTNNSTVPNSSKFAFCIKSKIECVRTNHRHTWTRSICSITIVTPTLITNSQFPFSNLSLNVTLKLSMCMKDPTFTWGEKVETKLDLIIRVIVKYPIKSCAPKQKLRTLPPFRNRQDMQRCKGFKAS